MIDNKKPPIYILGQDVMNAITDIKVSLYSDDVDEAKRKVDEFGDELHDYLVEVFNFTDEPLMRG